MLECLGRFWGTISQIHGFFQVQPVVTWCDLLLFLVEFEVYSIHPSKTIGAFLEILNLNRSFLKLNRFSPVNCHMSRVQKFRSKCGIYIRV